MTNDSDPKTTKKGRGRPAGTRTAEPSRYTERMNVAVTPAQRRELLRIVSQRKLADPDLPGRWGASDLIREVLQQHLLTSK